MKLISIALIVVGAGLVFWGYDLAGSIGSRFTETVSGTTPQDVMVRYIAGSAILTVGVFLFFKS
jgi:hypothetical protein